MSSTGSCGSCSTGAPDYSGEEDYDYEYIGSYQCESGSDTESESDSETSAVSTHDEPVEFERLKPSQPPPRPPITLLTSATDFAGRLLLLSLLYPLMLFGAAKGELPLLRESTSETTTEFKVRNPMLRVFYFLCESPKLTLAVLFNYKLAGTRRHRAAFGW